MKKLIAACIVLMSTPVIAASPKPYSYAASRCRAIDGDTIVCGSEHIRLNGVDAPEMHYCPKGRVCAPGNPEHAKAIVAGALARASRIRVQPFSKDRYGRTIAQVKAGYYDLSCLVLRGQFATYKPDWDAKKTTAKACRL